MTVMIEIRFVCCTKPLDAIKRHDPRNWHDTEGFLICPEHGGRRYGWRTRPKKLYASIPHAKRSQDQNFIDRIDFSRSLLESDQEFQKSVGLFSVADEQENTREAVVG